jgi:hypothetical protein
MAKALPSGRPHGRVLFGALDADSWSWAGLKALFWFVVIIMLLGYIPDRAYYFTVNRTIDLGIVLWSPINLCPAENGGLPCPAPVGAVVPWQASPTQLDLPEGRVNGSATQLGSFLVYAGGSNGSAATKTTYTSKTANGAFEAWAAGPDLPEARERAGIAVLNGSAYLVGGLGPDGKPTNTVWALTADAEKGTLGAWAPVEGVTLPEARAGAAVIPVSDGLLVVGGSGPDGKPTTTVWKSTANGEGKLGKLAEQPALLHAVSDASIALSGSFVWVYGGTDDQGPTGAVQRADFGKSAAAGGVPVASGSVTGETPAPSTGAQPDSVQRWAVLDAANLPEARTAASSWTANGAIYLAGGSDGQRTRKELFWATPNASGNLTDGWHRLDVSDLPANGVAGASAVLLGANTVLIGGRTDQGISKGSERASLAPQEPFFQLGIAGVVVPALQIPGEIGQQLGYLSAAGAGTLNFIVLVLIGWAFAHKAQVRTWWDDRRSRRRRRA